MIMRLLTPRQPTKNAALGCGIVFQGLFPCDKLQAAQGENIFGFRA